MRLPPASLACLLLAPLLLGGCDIIGNPTEGMGGFLGDVFRLSSNPNRPLLDSPNMRRVKGLGGEVEPLQVEAGNVWPGPLPPAKTMADLQRELNTGVPIDASPARGSSTPPGSSLAPPPQYTPSLPPAAPIGTPASQAAAQSRVIQTPGGPATTIIGGNGVETFTMPNGRSGIVMANPNGTLTLIGPDGVTQTVLAPR